MGNKVIFADCLPSDSAAENIPSVDPSAFYNALWNASERGMYALEVLEAGKDFRFIAFNQICAEKSPVSIEEIQGKRLSEAFPPDVARTYQKHYAQCVQTRQEISFNEKLCIGEHTTYWQLTAYPLIAASGVVTQLVVASLDITKEHRIAALVESRRILQQVIDTVPAAIFWKDCNSHYLGCNQSFAQIAGKETVEELVGKNDYDMVWKKEESDWFVACDRRIMQADKPELNIIEPILEASGRQSWVKTSKIPLHDATGKVSGILGIVEDITDRKDAEDQKNRLLAILEATPDVVSITDAGGKHRYLNQAGQHIFNVSATQIEDLSLGNLTPPDIAEMLLNKALPTATRFGSWSGESMIRDGNGQDIPVSHVIICHKAEDGTPAYFSSIMRDISDRKAAETILKEQSDALSTALKQLKRTQAQIIQSEKMSGLGQMVAGVAHEINNPVNFIHGNLQPATHYSEDLLELIDLYQKNYPEPNPEIENAIEEMELDFVRKDLPKLLSSMSMGTLRIREIVLSLRNFSRLDESDVKTVDLHEGLNSTLVILNHRLKTNNVDQAIEVVKNYGELPLVDCYPSQLNQVLMNILSNAVDALEKHPNPTITITTAVNDTAAAETQSGFVTIRIADNGPGIPKEIQPRILDPFFTTKEVGKGTGMGMSISYQIVTEKHGGSLSFVSAEGKGTEFVISIPIYQSGSDSAQPSG